MAAALSQRGISRGDRLALLLPNGPEYIQLIYACSWLGVIVVPINTRLSVVEIDHVLADASPHGLVRHSSLAAPSGRAAWEHDRLELRELDIAQRYNNRNCRKFFRQRSEHLRQFRQCFLAAFRNPH